MDQKIKNEDKNPVIMVDELTVEQLYQRLQEGFAKLAMPNACHLESGNIRVTHQL